MEPWLLCKVCRRRYKLDESEKYIRKKRNRKSPSKLQRRVRMLLLEIFKDYKIDEDVYFMWNTSNKGSLLQYDFYIPALMLAIEVQGEHHYKCVGKFRMKRTDLENIRRNDRKKATADKVNDIVLYYIKYDDDLRTKIINIYNDSIKKRRRSK